MTGALEPADRSRTPLIEKRHIGRALANLRERAGASADDAALHSATITGEALLQVEAGESDVVAIVLERIARGLGSSAAAVFQDAQLIAAIDSAIEPGDFV